MAKFGHFKVGIVASFAEYEGDTMEMEKEFVKIYKLGSIDGTYGPTHPERKLVAAIRLDKGHDIRKISD
jgi:hypothetical protein